MRSRLFWMLLFLGNLQTGCFFSESQKSSKAPMKVAVLSTGFELKNPAAPIRISPDSWNFLAGNSDLSDPTGHGTSLIQIAAKQCAECEFIALKADRFSVANDAGTLWVAIDRALEKGARVLLLPYAVMPTSDSLQAVLKKADDKGVLLVTAAGTGPKPFRPEAIEKIAPQSWPSALVVTAAESLRTPDAMTNKGNAIDLLVLQPRNVPTSELSKRSIYFGSEFAAAEIAGRAAAVWRVHSTLNPRQIRFVFREATGEAPYLYAEKLGYGGGFNGTKLTDNFILEKLKNPLSARVYVGSHAKRGFAGADPRAVTLDLNAGDVIEKIVAVNWICDGEKSHPISFSEKPAFAWSTQWNLVQAQKGRAQIQLQNPPCIPYKIQVDVKLKHQGRVSFQYGN